jgi:hypothetical protein
MSRAVPSVFPSGVLKKDELRRQHRKQVRAAEQIGRDTGVSCPWRCRKEYLVSTNGCDSQYRMPIGAIDRSN